MPQIRSVEELIQIIREHPEWREALLSALLPQDLLALPQEFRSFREEMREILLEHQKRMQAHEERMAEIEEQIALQRAEFDKRMQEMRETFEQRMQEMRADLERQIQETRAELEHQIQALRAEMIAGFKRVDERFEQVDKRFEQVDKRFEQIDHELKEIRDDLGKVKGIVLELQWGHRAKSYFGRLLRKVKVYAPGEIYDEIEERCPLSDAQRDQLLNLDYVVRGVRRSDGREVYLAVEISWGIGVTDVIRARDRAQILRECGYPTYPVAVGEFAIPEAETLAREEKVILMTSAGKQGAEFLEGD